jgi:hypothetical protein
MVIENACSVPTAPASASADVTAWRRRRLLESGFDESLAAWVAETPGVDLHAVLTLVDRGCPPETAIRILGPFGVTIPLHAAS